MTQVAYVQVFVGAVDDQCLTATGVFVNGTLVQTQELWVDDPDPCPFGVARYLETALGVTLKQVNHVVGEDWAWEEIATDLVNAESIEAPATGDLMRGFYRCSSCFDTWETCDTLNEAMLCLACEKELVEPYYSGPANATKDDALFSLARQERMFPNPSDQGAYQVHVSRTCTRQATILIENASGPASAHYDALDKAGGEEFGSEGDADYEVDSLSCVTPADVEAK